MHFPIVQIDDGRGTMRPEYRGVDNDIFTLGQSVLRKDFARLLPACRRGQR